MMKQTLLFLGMMAVAILSLTPDLARPLAINLPSFKFFKPCPPPPCPKNVTKKNLRFIQELKDFIEVEEEKKQIKLY